MDCFPKKLSLRRHVPKIAIYSTCHGQSGALISTGLLGFRALTEQRACFSVSKSFDQQTELRKCQPFSFSQNYIAL